MAVLPFAALPEQPAVAARTDDALAAVDRISAAARTATTAHERAAWLVALRRVVDSAEAGFTEVLQQFDAHGDAQRLTAAPTTAAWCRHQLNLAPGDASSRVAVARRSHALESPLGGLVQGSVTFEQVRAIAAGVRPLDAHPDHQAAAVTILTDLAASAHPGVIRAAGRRLRDSVCPDGSLPAAEQQFARRYLLLSPLLDGMTAVDGLLDPETTATLTAALAPLMVPTGPDDARSAAQRRADGLADLAALALRSEQLPQLSGTPASLDVLLPVGALLEAAGDQPSPAADPQAWRQLVELAGPVVAITARADATATPPGGLVLDHLGTSAWLPGHDIQRLACDAWLGRVILGADSVPLDLGRRARTFSPHQRRARAVRDARAP